MAFILIIETSTEVCSVALSEDGRVLDLQESAEGQNHARLVSVFVQEILMRNKIKASDLRAVAVSRGPGSYTGLRIGVSTAKGICYAGNLPLIAIGTLEAMTLHVSEKKVEYGIGDSLPTLFCPMLDARRMEVYSMLLDEHGNVLKPITAEIITESFLTDELSKNQVVFFGNGSEKCREVISSPNAVFVPGIKASAAHFGQLAFAAYQKQRFEDLAYFEPFYLKDFVATVTRKNVLG